MKLSGTGVPFMRRAICGMRKMKSGGCVGGKLRFNDDVVATTEQNLRYRLRTIKS